jgi:single-stranded-DNA-specific exonuclease
MIDGYGFNAPAVDAAKRIGARLIITVDCGITSLEAAARAKEEDIDVIITDHHEPLQQSETARGGAIEKGEFLLPDALAVINPKLDPARPALHHLSGAGIALKVVQALALNPSLPFSEDDATALFDLAALGTLADVVPLIGENRAIVRLGLKSVLNADRPGIRSLLEVSGLTNREIRAGLLSFTLVPRVNAAGRLGDAHEVVTLFLSPSYEETLSIAEKLDRTNTERQRIEEEVYQEARSQVNAKGYDGAIVLCGEGWHPGVIGIVASRIAGEFCRPAFIFSMKEGIAKGSARSIPGFDLHQGLSECRDILLSFGGHKQAAGVKLREEDLHAFEARMNVIAGDFIRKEDFVPTVMIDASLTLSEISTSLVQELALLEPIGCGNPDPLLGAKALEVLSPRIVGNNHVRMKLKQRSSCLDAIGFDMGRDFERLSAKKIDAVFTPAINRWNGGQYLQMNLKAFRPSE